VLRELKTESTHGWFKYLMKGGSDFWALIRKGMNSAGINNNLLNIMIFMCLNLDYLIITIFLELILFFVLRVQIYIPPFNVAELNSSV
jgi:hypothetical protein